MGQPVHRDELGIDHFGIGMLGLTYAEAKAVHDLAVHSVPPARCRHLGPILDMRACEGCGGKTIAVHQCEVHGECTMQINRDGIKFCPCPEFSESLD